MSGDKIVALLGLVMALMIVSNGVIWALILGLGAVIAAWVAPAGHP